MVGSTRSTTRHRLRLYRLGAVSRGGSSEGTLGQGLGRTPGGDCLLVSRGLVLLLLPPFMDTSSLGG